MVVANHLGIEHHVAYRRSGERRSEGAAIRCAQSQHANADVEGWRLCAVGIRCHPQYLAGKKPESGLLPRDERGRLDVTRWQFWDVCHWDPGCAVFIFEHLVKPIVLKSGEPDQAAIAKGAENFHRAAKVLDDQLRGRKFVTGETLTLADFSIGASMNLADMAHYPIAQYAEIKRWYASLRALPAWQKSSGSAPWHLPQRPRSERDFPSKRAPGDCPALSVCNRSSAFPSSHPGARASSALRWICASNAFRDRLTLVIDAAVNA